MPSCWLWQSSLCRQALIGGETLLLSLVALFTGWIDRAETIQAGQHLSAYGPLFPLYLLHILFFTLLALFVAWQPARSLPPLTRTQLRLVGMGILATVLVGFVTDALLPYWYHDFRYIHVGTLSTIAFLSTVAYAAVNYHLFNVRVLLKATFVYTLLIAFARELYQLAVQALARLLPLGDPSERHMAAATLALIIHAVTQQPLRWWLERLADRFLNVPHPSHKERH